MDRVRKILKYEKYDKRVIRMVNSDEILTEEEMCDIIEAIIEREKGHYYKINEVFE